MACILNSGYALGCKDNTGGIQEIYIANFSGSATYGLDADNIITSTNSSASFYTFEQRNENAEFTSEGQHSVENGTNFWIQTANLIFHKNEADVRNTLLLLAKSSLSAIVLDQNGKYWLMGKQNGVELVGSSTSFGKAYGDLNGVTISIEAREPEPAHEMSSAAFAALTVN
jgi:hypothetical protein